MKIYTIVLINGKTIEIDGDGMMEDDEYIHFLYDNEEVGVFKKGNIAGWFVDEYEDSEE